MLQIQKMLQILDVEDIFQSDTVRFYILLYRFCLLTLGFLNAETIMAGLEAPEGTSAARYMLELLIPKPLELSYPFHRQFAVMMLTMGGLALLFVAGDNGKLTQSIFC